jgi:prepilin-type N-terminal cleavage/methylation domain-containing protein
MLLVKKTSPSGVRHRTSNSGFTLIELLMVIAVIMILAGITFGISRGVQNAQARAQAKAELATLSQAIEQFKLRYGDYPWHDSDDSEYPSTSGEVTNTMLVYALTGRLEMVPKTTGSGVDVQKVADSLDAPEVEKKPKFIDVTKFSTSGTDAIPEAFLDPWGNPYIYWYKWEKSSGDWEVFGYHLYSTGPNGSAANAAIKGSINAKTGALTAGYRDVANENGIIFSGE